MNDSRKKQDRNTEGADTHEQKQEQIALPPAAIEHHEQEYYTVTQQYDTREKKARKSRPPLECM